MLKRPGLSRIVRTPLQQASPQYQPLNVVKIEPDNKLDHIKPVSNDPAILTEAKDFSECVKTDSRSSHKEIKKKVERDKVKGTPSTCFNNEGKAIQSVKDKDKLNSRRVSKSNLASDKETVSSSSQKGTHKVNPEKLENVKVLKHVNCELNQVVKSELRVMVEKSCEKEQIGCKSKSVEKKEVKPKKSLKRLSMKRSSSNNDSISDLEDYPSPVESIQMETNILNGIAYKTKKPRIDVIVEDVVVDTITDIQNRVKIKKEKLRQLQQAATYKKIHNADELEKLIDVWKNGCRRALDQLHQKLQSHGPISMETLVQKFNIPEDIVDNL
ncbi:hypothetical protein FQR65_LT06170 [Abscondita terminalis]|nr:hypothetical protein FQR65_LT06170 [Abscondita terminalis]